MKPKMNGRVFGYDPGGNGKHGLASLDIKVGEVVSAETKTVQTVQHVIDEILMESCPIGIGIDTLTEWRTGTSGVRSADDWLCRTYVKCKQSVLSPNELRGAMVINGMIVLLRLRDRWQKLPASETHPKVVFHALTGRELIYGDVGLPDRIERLLAWLGLGEGTVQIRNNHEWDALISAFCVLKGLRGEWTNNLHEPIRAVEHEMVRPAGRTFYFWPE
jgi:hypothetical protein